MVDRNRGPTGGAGAAQGPGSPAGGGISRGSNAAGGGGTPGESHAGAASTQSADPGAAGQGTGGGAGTIATGGSSASAAGGTDAGIGGMPARSLVGDYCWPEDTLGCDGTNQRTLLLCGKGAVPKWQLAGQCAANEHCDNRAENAGHCAPVLPECVGRDPYQGSCAGNVYFECGVDLVTRAFEQNCTARCELNSVGADCIQAGCGDGTLSAAEACDDGNNQNGDGCSAGCRWEPPHGKVAPHAKTFGETVAMSGDTIVVAGGDDPDGTWKNFAPAVYVYRNSGLSWSLEAKLPVEREYHDALALEGDTLAIEGEDSSDTVGSGAVLIFQRSGTTWVHETTLLPTLPDGTRDGVDSENFGAALQLTQDTLVVGAYGDKNQGNYSGAVYVFRRSGSSFTPEAKLVASLPGGSLDGVDSGSFGQAVSLSGDTLAVGALEARTGGFQTGAAYVFTRSGAAWTATAKVLAKLPNGKADATPGDQFGSGVALRGDLLVVGSHDDEQYAGSAYVYRKSGSAWTPEAHLLPPADPPNANSSIAEFGQTVAISESGKLIVIGSPRDRNTNTYSGSIHVFAYDGTAWKLNAELLAVPARGASLNVAESYFGWSIAMCGDRILTGAYTAAGSGRAYLFQPKDAAWETRLELQALDP